MADRYIVTPVSGLSLGAGAFVVTDTNLGTAFGLTPWRDEAEKTARRMNAQDRSERTTDGVAPTPEPRYWTPEMIEKMNRLAEELDFKEPPASGVDTRTAADKVFDEVAAGIGLLTDDEIRTIWRQYDLGAHATPMTFARLLEARIRGVAPTPGGQHE